MKKFISMMLVFAMLLSTAVLSASAEYDFRQFNWGDSMDRVMEVEGTPYMDGEVNGVDANYIAYETSAVGLDMMLAYYFCDDGLYQVLYLLTESHSVDSLYIDDYDTYKSAMIKKYGEPLIDDEDWESDSQKDYYADRKGDALSYGYLSYTTAWILDGTIILMKMSADNFDITMTVSYSSRNISPGEADFSDQI